eukprot:3016093-Prymnesium_polylepis.1
MITGEISEVGRHIRKASTRFMEDRDDRLMVDAGGNLSQLWSRAQELRSARMASHAFASSTYNSTLTSMAARASPPSTIGR